ncbi:MULTISPECIES: nicotinamide riboside transporter PnuC [unclassified Francisella]|uniref:nicotinamide riboside transporter PnuC n=1 Tax=unclassified Francisella TaxID=2610885 RepID=UPI002E34497C|nr:MULTISPECIES: nicotinamide riboside transporter PnuC [unclassified Francisella]MED7819747.1 nicotinamide riboside transporter PnuC [Francisella sp. 19S2-4]MED7830567.1 nicotinamide riboside transporter PnuC [Francisella sp. 19S2-10]
MINQILSNFFLQIFNYLKGFRDIELGKIFSDYNAFEILWLICSVVVLGLISILTTDKYLVLTTIATVTGMLNLFLIAKGKILNYFFAFINNLTYAYVCYQQGIFGQFLLFTFFFFPMQFYGLYNWTKPQNIGENNDIVTRSLNNKQRLYLFIGIVIAAILYGVFILKGIFNQQVGLFADSLTGVVSVVAIILMVKAYLEQWALWIVINTLSTIIWIQQYISGSSDSIAFLAMWLIYLFNAVYGYVNWKKLQKNS